jgi:hypothetical protein
MSDEKSDPRLHEVEGDDGMPGEFIDTPSNLPGDQDDDPHRPSLVDAEKDPDDD